MPCTAKKFEAQRPELGVDGLSDVDAVLTTRELVKMLKSSGIHFEELEDSEFDNPLNSFRVQETYLAHQAELWKSMKNCLLSYYKSRT